MTNQKYTPQKWVRSQNGWIAGVCGGLGQSFGFDPLLLRLLWLVSVLFLGFGLFVYIGLALALPREDKIHCENPERFLGVCYRISQRTGVEVGLVRFFCLILMVSSLGVTMIGYFVLHFVLDQRGNH